MRATIQKIFDYENLIDDLLRDYALKKQRLSTPEKAQIIKTIMLIEDAIFRLKQSLPKLVRKNPSK